MWVIAVSSILHSDVSWAANSNNNVSKDENRRRGCADDRDGHQRHGGVRRGDTRAVDKAARGGEKVDAPTARGVYYCNFWTKCAMYHPSFLS